MRGRPTPSRLRPRTSTTRRSSRTGWRPSSAATPSSYASLLAATDKDQVFIGPPPASDSRKAFDDGVTDGTLAGVSIQPVPELAVAGSDGVTLLSDTGAVVASVAIDGGAHGLALVSGVDDGTQLYASSQNRPSRPAARRSSRCRARRPRKVRWSRPRCRCPAPVTKVVFDAASEMVEVLGTTPDGSGSTVYVVETHGKSVFADQRVPFTPVAWALDHNEDYPTGNRGQLLAFASNGETGSLDVGHYPFAWRLPGVIMGALTVAFLFLLTRILFRRRAVAVLVGLFVLLDGMFFVQSRIAMNDVYTGVFIVAAYALFAWLWLEPRAAEVGVLDADAGRRRAARPRARVEVGRRLRDRRPRDPDPRPVGARTASC